VSSKMYDHKKLLTQVEFMATGVDIEALRVEITPEFQQESAKAQNRKHKRKAVGEGFTEQDFDRVIAAFNEYATPGAEQVVDRIGLNLAQFTSVLVQVKVKSGSKKSKIDSNHTKVLFDLFDDNCNGTVSLEELVEGITALHPKSTAEQCLTWMFNKFDKNNDNALDLHEVAQFSEFVQVLQCEQLPREHMAVRTEPVVWEAQQWFPAMGWRKAWDRAFTDGTGEDVAAPSEGTGWQVAISPEATDSAGWKYAKKLPPIQDLAGAHSATLGSGHYSRWRQWQNRMPALMMEYAGSDTMSAEQFIEIINEHFSMVHAALRYRL